MRKLTQPLPSAYTGDPLGKSLPQDSAVRHVCGTAVYIDDMPAFTGELHIATYRSEHAHARIVSLDLSAVRKAPGVVDVIVQSDVPGSVDISPVFEGDLILAGGVTTYMDQPLFAVAATSFELAHRAVALATVEYEVLSPRLDVADSMANEDFVLPTRHTGRGDPEQAFEQCDHILEGSLHVGGQEHFYLEGQVCAVTPQEDGGVQVFCSSQHPSEVQKLVAEVLDIPLHAVQVEVRRMGGAFGGKESQAGALACLAAVFCRRTNRPIRYRMPRKHDMVQTGKRHPFSNHYRVGFQSDGSLAALAADLQGNCGCTADLSEGIVDRAMNHIDNAYAIPASRVSGYRCRTNLVSHTAFRGFGGPQAVVTTEGMMDDIARFVGLDPLDVRKRNLYQQGQETPYGQAIEDSVLPDLVAQLETDCDYRARRIAVTEFNQQSSVLKRGLSLTPVKFGISFTSTHLNQAAALVHVYTDGSIHLSHGGTEMGQGLYIKVAQLVANAFGVSVERVMVSATRTDKVANASPTAASAGTDMNGMAALDACNKIKKALIEYAVTQYQCDPTQISFREDKVFVADDAYDFGEFVAAAYMARTPLSASGFYRTPRIWFDKKTGQGRPFLYFANGACCSEVIVDTRTGEYRLERVDILHDVGRSLNPAVDIGQIEGGFVQGLGWLTSEELCWDESGRLLSNSPANYKIPTAIDVPEHFQIDLFQRPNTEDTVYRSKAVGEPPLMLPVSVWCALRDACASLCDYQFNPTMDPPATPERVYWAAQQAAAGVKP